jgi:hypothetical protein
VLDFREATESVPLDFEEPIRMIERLQSATERNGLEMWKHCYQYKVPLENLTSVHSLEHRGHDLVNNGQ